MNVAREERFLMSEREVTRGMVLPAYSGERVLGLRSSQPLRKMRWDQWSCRYGGSNMVAAGLMVLCVLVVTGEREQSKLNETT